MLLSLGLVAGPPSRASDWPMFRHDAARTGATADALKLPLKRAWTYKTGAQAILSSPVVADGSVYFGTRDNPTEAGKPATPKGTMMGGGLGSLYAVNAATGALRWRFNSWEKAGIGWVDSTPAVVGDRIYFSARDGYFYCVSTGGKQVWRTPTGGAYDSSSPAVVNGNIYFASGPPNKSFLCLRAADGAFVWKTEASTETRGAQYTYSSPAVSGNLAYVGANNAVLFALDTATGKPAWHFDVKGGNPYYFAPLVAQGKVYFLTSEFDPNLYAVDALSGKEVWRFTAPGQFFFNSSPALGNGLIYVGMGNPDQTLYAVEAATGKQKWSFGIGQALAYGFTSSPAVAGGLVVVGGGPASAKSLDPEGALYVLDGVSGALKFRDPLPRPALASPAVANGQVFVGALDGTLYSYRDSSGAGASSTTSPKAKRGAPALKRPKARKK